MDLTTSMVQCNLNPEWYLYGCCRCWGVSVLQCLEKNWGLLGQSCTRLEAFPGALQKPLPSSGNREVPTTNVGTRVYPLCSHAGPINLLEVCFRAHICTTESANSLGARTCDTTARGCSSCQNWSWRTHQTSLQNSVDSDVSCVRSLSTFIAVPGGEPSKFTWRPFALRGAVTVPRLRRYHQKEAAKGAQAAEELEPL